MPSEYLYCIHLERGKNVSMSWEREDGRSPICALPVGNSTGVGGGESRSESWEVPSSQGPVPFETFSLSTASWHVFCLCLIFFSPWSSNYKTTHHINLNTQWRYISYALECGLPLILLFSLSQSLSFFLLPVIGVEICYILRGVQGRMDDIIPAIHPSICSTQL